ncbi:hypothetical protein D9M68_955040 [compost metagenome]
MADTMAGGMPEKIACTWPPATSVRAWLLPLYGMCTMFTLACCANSAPARCKVEPVPDDA